MREKLKELDEASGEAWRELRTGFEEAWDEFSSAVRQSRERFG